MTKGTRLEKYAATLLATPSSWNYVRIGTHLNGLIKLATNKNGYDWSKSVQGVSHTTVGQNVICSTRNQYPSVLHLHACTQAD